VLANSDRAGDDIPFDITPGSVFDGKYRVERALGEGGMGVVIGARHLHLDELAAIKVLRPELCADSDLVERFLREARSAAKIKSPHVVRVIDVDRLPSGAPYIVMEWLEGSDLASIMQREGPLDPARAVRYVREACEALSQVHAAGIVHRDLKPGNLFVARLPDGSTCTKVLDFGISKLLGEDFTRTGMALGTPSYMAPEQMATSRTVDARTDIWALGVVLYKLVTGTLPFKGATPVELGMKVLFSEPDPPEHERPGLPPELGQVILRCLRRKPEERFATAAELSAALAPFAAESAASNADAPGLSKPRAGDAARLEHAAAIDATANGSDSRTGDSSGNRSTLQDATPKPIITTVALAKRGHAARIAIAATVLVAGAGLALWTFGSSSTFKAEPAAPAQREAVAPAPSPEPAAGPPSEAPPLASPEPPAVGPTASAAGLPEGGLGAERGSSAQMPRSMTAPSVSDAGLPPSGPPWAKPVKSTSPLFRPDAGIRLGKEVDTRH
jgi:serine/threonine protein kinase